ncbi:lantibiotic dehydratase C-terminal domain-containing protein [Streptomyces calidiresistens]
MTVDVSPTSPVITDGRLTHLTDWITAFHWLGRQPADLNHRGHLVRGLRGVLAHHVIFHWNRPGLPARSSTPCQHSRKR